MAIKRIKLESKASISQPFLKNIPRIADKIIPKKDRVKDEYGREKLWQSTTIQPK
jgi:hypothetical protein